MSTELAKRLLDWYQKNARGLPWRGLTESYAVWVSEVMLQQTRVETVIPYYKRWMEKFPTVFDLAQASQQEVLSAWEGMGYYSRGRNLHRAARIVVERYGGELPAQVEEMRKLPGIGRYTAGAIASIAFGQDEPALDGNIRRVLARLFDVSHPVRSKAGEHRLWELAAENLPVGQAGAYNQALMDLGATLCTPRNPDCSHCPVMVLCQAWAKGIVEERPVLGVKATIPHYTVTAAVIQRDDKVLVTQRPIEGLLGGLWEFPGGKLKPGEDLLACLKREIREELGVEIQVGGLFGEYKHAYTHFRITLHAYHCELVNGEEPRPLQVQEVRWMTPGELGVYPMGKIDRLIANKIVAQSQPETKS